MHALMEPEMIVVLDEGAGSTEAGRKPAPFPDDIRYYGHITLLLFAAYAAALLGIVLVHAAPVRQWLASLFGPVPLRLIEMYFWGALGGTMSAYQFLARDKSTNELESLKEKPDPQTLRYPNLLDVALYAQWVLFSGALAVLGAVVALAGLAYFEAEAAPGGLRQQMFLVVFAFLVGFYQTDFVGFLSGLSKRFFRQKEQAKNGGAQAAS